MRDEKMGRQSLSGCSFSLKFWLLCLACLYVDLLEETHARSVDGRLREASQVRQLNPDEGSKNGSIDNHFQRAGVCRYIRNRKRLICNGTLDLSYLKKFQHERIVDFIVDKYTAESPSHPITRAKPENSTVGRCSLSSKYNQKLTVQVQLKNTGLKVTAITNVWPRSNSTKEFTIQGGAFSTKLVKLSQTLRGNITLDLGSGRKVVRVAVETLESDTKWNLQSNLTLTGGKSTEAGSYDLSVFGWIATDLLFESPTTYFGGRIVTAMNKKDCEFAGEVILPGANLIWNLMGSVTSPHDKEITIPKAAFSNMTVKNLVFKDSNFFNDFHKDVFKGLYGVETVSFLSSKLELMPDLDDLFGYFTNLKEIHIEDCTTPHLRFGTKSTLRNVTLVSFKGTGPLNFYTYSFLWLKHSNLTVLNLRNSYVVLSDGTESVLSTISNTLLYLDISHSNIRDEKSLGILLADLRIIHLTAEGLRLKEIPKLALTNVQKTLKYLSLRGSNFGKVIEKNMFNTIFNFPRMLELNELNLMECQINYLERGAFDSLPKLRILHLGNNNLENLQDGWVVLKPPITHLYLMSNGLSSQTPYLGVNTMGASLNLSIFDELKVLNLSNGIFINTKKAVETLVGSNLRHLSLRNTGLIDLPDDTFWKFTGLEILDLSYNRNIKSFQEFSINLFRNLKNLKSLILTGCRIIGGTIEEGWRADGGERSQIRASWNVNVLKNLINLDLSHNNIKIIDSGSLKIFPNLKILNLSGNRVTTWKRSLFDTNPYLEAVFLDENKIDTITPAMLADLKRLRYTKLGSNPFTCGPYVYDILDLVRSVPGTQQPEFEYAVSPDPVGPGVRISPKFAPVPMNVVDEPWAPTLVANESSSDGNVTILDWPGNSYVCFSRSKTKFIPFTQVNESFEGLVIVLVVGMVFWKLGDIHLIAKAVKNAVALSFVSRSRNTDPAKYKYNVFVSYSEKDRSWVIDNLIPRLESKTDVKVCLHERDFQVGLSILENIVASIDNSCNIVLVLSKSFLKSQWCQYEMHLAQHRLLEKGSDQLILILLENIPIVKRPKTLRYLMMTKTYLEWPVNPKNPKEVEQFWSRLMKALNEQ